MINLDEKKYLLSAFSDLLNYSSDDPTEPINPLTYRTPEGDSCLHVAAARGDIRAVEILIREGMDVNEKGDMGNTSLHYASKGKHNEVENWLVKSGALPELLNDFGQKAA